MAIEVCLLFKFAAIFDINLFPVPPSKNQFVGYVLMNRQTVDIMSMFFFIFYKRALAIGAQNILSN
jgi:hypothetical protein